MSELTVTEGRARTKVRTDNEEGRARTKVRTDNEEVSKGRVFTPKGFIPPVLFWQFSSFRIHKLFWSDGGTFNPAFWWSGPLPI